ncbi:hypothetical protein MBLNU230_g8169t1 [Neophaeotheca triangularis]
MPPRSILIVGNGIAGPVLASFLLLAPVPAQELPHITILERSAAPRPNGQNIDVRGAGVAICRKLGILTAIKAHTTGEEGVKFVDANNVVWATGAADKTGRVQTGTSDIEILRGRLAKICYERSLELSQMKVREGGRGVEYVFGGVLKGMEQVGEKVEVVFASGERSSFDLVVGADGLQSRTRGMAFGQEAEEVRRCRLGLYGGFFSMPSGPNDGLWRRWFHAPGSKSIMVRPGETKGTTTVTMFICKEDERLARAATGSRKDIQRQKALIRESFQNDEWECPRILDAMDSSDDFYYDMVAQIKMDTWSKGRIVLLGDAGYCASPISGMGTTLALTGAYNLAGALSRHPNDHTAAFVEYDDQMRPVVDRAQKLPPGMPQLVHPETALGVMILRFLMWCIHASGIVNLLFRLKGPPANDVVIEDFEFREVPEMEF